MNIFDFIPFPFLVTVFEFSIVIATQFTSIKTY